jgi:hypothetical protein
VQAGNLNNFSNKAILNKEVTVKSNNLMIGLGKHSYQNSANVAMMAGY